MSHSQACPACFSTSLTDVNGTMVCDVCGTQSLGFAEQQEHHYEQGARIRRIQAVRAVETLNLPPPVDTKSRLQSVSRVYLLCMQHLLQAQAGALAQLCGDSTLVDTIHHLWFAFLRHVRFGETDSIQSYNVAGASNPANARGMPNDVEDVVYTIVRVVPHQVSAGLCFLACLITRRAVMPSDMVRWLLSARLPYLGMRDLCADVLAAAEGGSDMPTTLLEPSVVPGASDIVVSACELAGLLGLEVPCIALEGLLARACRDMCLPQGILLVALELASLYALDSPLLNLLVQPKAHSPYAVMAGLLVTALLLGYGLDGGPTVGSRLPGLPPPPQGGWGTWARWVVATWDAPLPYTTDPKKAGTMRGEQLDAYLSHCEEVLFAACEPPAAMRDAHGLMRTLGASFQAGSREEGAADVSGSHVEGGEVKAQQGQGQGREPEARQGAWRQRPWEYERLGQYTRDRSHVHPDVTCVVAAVTAYVGSVPSRVLRSSEIIQQVMLKVELALGNNGSREGESTAGAEAVSDDGGDHIDGNEDVDGVDYNIDNASPVDLDGDIGGWDCEGGT